MFQRLVMTAIGCVVAGSAGATAQIGGGIGTSFTGGFGSCNRSQRVPLDTAQDSFALSLAASCDGGAASASGALRGDAVSRSVGMQLAAAGSSSAAAEVRFFDTWLLTVAPGTLPGMFTMPVSFTLDGSVTPGAFARLGGIFLGYSFSTRDIYSGLPSSSYAVAGNILSTGSFVQTFAGTVDFRYLGVGSSLQPTAEVEMILRAPQIEFGALDFFNSATASLVLPAGWSATTASGLALSLPVAPAVPEPSSLALMLLGLVGLWKHLRWPAAVS